MCGRFGSIPTGAGKRFDIDEFPLFDANYNIAPSAMVPVITRNSPNRATLMKWGLVPSWSKTSRVKYSTINAQSETIQEKPVYRTAVKNNQRCIIPASFFYEWEQVSGEKQPYLIRVKHTALFGFAGFYDIWRDPDPTLEREIATFTILTTTANKLVGTIHTRMPVILHQKDEKAWLTKDTPEDAWTMLMKPYPEKDMEMYQVSREVNNPRNNDPRLIERMKE